MRLPPALALIVAATVALAGCSADLAARDRLNPGPAPTPIPVSSTPATVTESTEDTPSPTPTPTERKSRTYRGVGAKVLKVKETEDVLIVTLKHSGSSNFIVHPIDPGGAEQSTIVNEIGNYMGTVLVNADAGKVLRGFKIQADGAWTVTIKPLTAVRMWSGERATGRSDEVLGVFPTPSGLTTMKINHSGSGNFIVYAYGTNATDLLVNEIGSYRGEVLLPDGTALVTVQADGKWSLRKSS